MPILAEWKKGPRGAKPHLQSRCGGQSGGKSLVRCVYPKTKTDLTWGSHGGRGGEKGGEGPELLLNGNARRGRYKEIGVL